MGMAGSVSKITMALGAASALALAAGCTTANYADDDYSAPHYASNDGGRDRTRADRLYRNGYFRDTRPETAQVYAALSQPMDPRSFAQFDGIAGARLAHEIYPEAQAERLDGACERFVRIAQGEDLYDIAQYCDVSVALISDLNPSYRNARHARPGDLIEVPQVYNAERAAFMAGFATNSIVAASAYVVQPGDTLNDIAAKHLTSAAAVATLNQTVNWNYLQVGETIWIPAAVSSPGAVVVTPPPYLAPPKPGAVSGSLPYNYGHTGSGGSGSGYDVTGIMPYQLTPAQKANEQNAPRGLLTISARTVNPGEEVTVYGQDLPAYSDVSIYRGPNGRELTLVKRVRTDANGRFEEPFGVSDKAGGIIFQATVDGSDERLQSPRVGVVEKD